MPATWISECSSQYDGPFAIQQLMISPGSFCICAQEFVKVYEGDEHSFKVGKLQAGTLYSTQLQVRWPPYSHGLHLR